MPQLEGGKNTIVDVLCSDVRGRKFCVEMQMEWSDAFQLRVLFNASKLYVSQAKKGGKYSELQPVYSLDVYKRQAYSSVYCNLKSVSVHKGQKVSTRQALGSVGSDNILQFLSLIHIYCSIFIITVPILLVWKWIFWFSVMVSYCLLR